MRLLAARYEFDNGVEVADLGTPALDLIDQISAKDAVILIDSIETDAAPGTVVLYHKADIVRHCPAVRMDPHSPALVDTLLGAEFFGVAPADVLLVGIQAGSFEAGCELSVPVTASVDQAIAEVLSELDRLGVAYRRREHQPELVSGGLPTIRRLHSGCKFFLTPSTRLRETRDRVCGNQNRWSLT